MKGWDGVRAWRFIRASEGYRKAWRRHNPPLGLPEPAPFPVRLQTGVDLAALEWGMFAWEDPYAERPIAPFWVRAQMSDGMVTPDARPLAALAAEGGAALAGLRIGDGSLILKIERKGAAAQVRIPGGGAFPADGGLLLVREVARIENVWSGVPAPRRGRVRTRALLTHDASGVCKGGVSGTPGSTRRPTPSAGSRSASPSWSEHQARAVRTRCLSAGRSRGSALRRTTSSPHAAST